MNTLHANNKMYEYSYRNRIYLSIQRTLWWELPCVAWCCVWTTCSIQPFDASACCSAQTWLFDVNKYTFRYYQAHGMPECTAQHADCFQMYAPVELLLFFSASGLFSKLSNRQKAKFSQYTRKHECVYPIIPSNCSEIYSEKLQHSILSKCIFFVWSSNRFAVLITCQHVFEYTNYLHYFRSIKYLISLICNGNHRCLRHIIWLHGQHENELIYHYFIVTQS